MAVYEYRALDNRGKDVNGIVDADSAVARTKLRRQGIFPTDVWEQSAGGATRGSGLSREIDLGPHPARIRSRFGVATGQPRDAGQCRHSRGRSHFGTN